MPGRRAKRPWIWPIAVILVSLAIILVMHIDRKGAFAPPATSAVELEDGLFVFDTRDGPALTSPIASGGNVLLNWADLEPAEGEFRWAPLDKALADAAANGKRLIPRIYTNIDGYGQATPNWFFDTPRAQSYYPTPWARSQRARAPVPWDPLFIDKFGRFLEALGSRYNGNPTIEFFQTNAGSGIYGEMVLGNPLPTGWTTDVQAGSLHMWIDRWRQAFPDTHLSLMVNDVDFGLAEDASVYAVTKGFYLQQNSPWLSPAAVALFAAHNKQTRLVLEVEDSGCRSAEGSAFDKMIRTVFNYGFRIDYLLLCSASFRDPGTAQKLAAIRGKLR